MHGGCVWLRYWLIVPKCLYPKWDMMKGRMFRGKVGRVCVCFTQTVGSFFSAFCAGLSVESDGRRSRSK
jgi:hypothetical protein